MPLKKIPPAAMTNNIQNGMLYRGARQSSFETNILHNFVSGSQYYFGLKRAHDESGLKLTFCDNIPSASLWYAMHACHLEDNLADTGGHFDHINFGTLSYIFTQSPIVLGIKAAPYIDRLYTSTDGEGLVIAGDIELEDISVLYAPCSRINKLVDFAGLDKAQKSRIETDIRTTEATIRRVKDELKSKYSDEPAHDDLIDMDLIDKYKNHRKHVIVALCNHAYGPSVTGYTQEQTNTITEYLSVLRKILRPDKTR